MKESTRTYLVPSSVILPRAITESSLSGLPTLAHIESFYRLFRQLGCISSCLQLVRIHLVVLSSLLDVIQVISYFPTTQQKPSVPPHTAHGDELELAHN